MVSFPPTVHVTAKTNVQKSKRATSRESVTDIYRRLMLLSRLYAPVRAATKTPYTATTAPCLIDTAFDTLRSHNTSHANPILKLVRNASHQAQGRANGAKDGPGKRLGAKKTGEQYVIPGNIIFRQRGTHWFPGDNCAMGRDHTIYATQPGYVKHYRDPLKHPKRQYIGVVFERHQTLPQPPNAARRRRLGMLAVNMENAEATEGVSITRDLEAGAELGHQSNTREVPQTQLEGKKVLSLRPGYMYREANWEIGRAAEKANIKVREFKPRDRFTAWRKATVRKAKNAEKRGMRRKQKG